MFHESFEPKNVKEAEPSVEEELSSEVLEQIMAKVQDINKPGTAYSAFKNWSKFDNEKSDDQLTSVLSSGLLGLRGPKINENIDKKKQWVKNVRSLKKRREGKYRYEDLPYGYDQDSAVFFNIVGRSDIEWGEIDKNKLEVEQTFFTPSPDNISVIFSLDKFKERDEEFYKLDSELNDPYQNQKRTIKKTKELEEEIVKKYPPKLREFFSSDSSSKNPKSDDGHLLHYRVRPQWFCGLILSDSITNKNEVIDHEEMTQRAKEVAKKMCEVDKDKPKLLLPIYDIHGNLLWPKKMSYGEVKKMVQEKEENK